jgi:glycosyltransferase involved in cell wall biosynthesis
MGRASALVLFSNQETLPCVVAEAMAAGLPVIAASVGALAEMLDGGRLGTLVPRGDEVALSDAITAILLGGSEAEARAVLARERARALYSPEVVAQATVDAYRTLLVASGVRDSP